MTVEEKKVSGPKELKNTYDLEYAPTEYAYIYVKIGSQINQIKIALFGQVCPKTVENFSKLCNGTMINGKKVSYEGTVFHRVIPGFMAQGGDTDCLGGRGGESIYGKKFEDENFTLKHKNKYMLSMANAGKNTNGS